MAEIPPRDILVWEPDEFSWWVLRGVAAWNDDSRQAMRLAAFPPLLLSFDGAPQDIVAEIRDRYPAAAPNFSRGVLRAVQDWHPRLYAPRTLTDLLWIAWATDPRGIVEATATLLDRLPRTSPTPETHEAVNTIFNLLRDTQHKDGSSAVARSIRSRPELWRSVYAPRYVMIGAREAPQRWVEFLTEVRSDILSLFAEDAIRTRDLSFFMVKAIGLPELSTALQRFRVGFDLDWCAPILLEGDEPVLSLDRRTGRLALGDGRSNDSGVPVDRALLGSLIRQVTAPTKDTDLRWERLRSQGRGNPNVIDLLTVIAERAKASDSQSVWGGLQ